MADKIKKFQSKIYIFYNSIQQLYAFNVYNKTFLWEIITKINVMNVKNIYIFFQMVKVG